MVPPQTLIKILVVTHEMPGQERRCGNGGSGLRSAKKKTKKRKE